MSVAVIDHCVGRDVVGVARVGDELGRLLAGPPSRVARFAP